jgi:formylglycine-generating enzyme required for sulfatase activity
MVANGELSPQALPMNRLFPSIVAVFFTAFTLIIQPSVQAETFGTSGNEFTIDFVNIGNTGNAADTTSYGAVPYEYRVGKYEISDDAITKATASGMANVTAGPWTGSQPAGKINWYQAAAFVNWLNTSTGKRAAYDLSFIEDSWRMTLQSSSNAWTLGGINLYRNKDAYYFLPSENEWYKAAYYNPAGSNYFEYPTGSSTAPTPVASGTNAGTAVYYGGDITNPAAVTFAGGLSPYGTMGQGGNVWEWNESAFDGTNSSPSEDRVFRGGNWLYNESLSLLSSSRYAVTPETSGYFGNVGFRVASVPEPSTYAFLAMTAAGALWMARRRR